MCGGSNNEFGGYPAHRICKGVYADFFFANDKSAELTLLGQNRQMLDLGLSGSTAMFGAGQKKGGYQPPLNQIPCLLRQVTVMRVRAVPKTAPVIQCMVCTDTV